MLGNLRAQPLLSVLILILFLAASAFVIIVTPQIAHMHLALPQFVANSAQANDLPAPTETAIRWMMYLTASALMGSLIFGLLVWRPAYHQWEQPNREADLEATRTMRRMMLIGIVGLALASIGYGMLNALWVRPQAVEAVSARALLMWGRLALLAVAGTFIWHLTPAATGPKRFWIATLLMSAVILLTFSLQSHAAATGLLLPIIFNYIHVMASAAWIGGLIPLAALLSKSMRYDVREGRSIPLRILIPHFSNVAMISVGTLVITGLFSASLLVRTPQALIATGYGHALIIKSLMVGMLLALGAINLLVLSPRLKNAEFTAGGWMLRTVRTELTIGLMVMVATSLIAGAVPAFKTYSQMQSVKLTENAEIDQVAIHLSADPYPLVIGDRLDLEIVDSRPGSEATSGSVIVQVGNRAPITLSARPDGRYALRGDYLKMLGPWDVTITVRRSGFEDVRHTFNLRDHD